MSNYRVTFGSYGQTFFSKDGEQVPELQVPWFVLCLREIQRQGIDPRDVEFKMPSGERVFPFVTEDGAWNFSVHNSEHVRNARSRPLPELP